MLLFYLNVHGIIRGRQISGDFEVIFRDLHEMFFL